MEKQPLLEPPASGSLRSGCLPTLLSRCLPSVASIKANACTLRQSGSVRQWDSWDEPLDSEALKCLPHQVKVLSSESAASKLRRLRELMRKHKIAVYIIPNEDEHQSEYTALADKRREFISGFSGSAGICVVTLTDSDLKGHAALSTDGRYFLQAEKELDGSQWTLLKQGVAGYPTWREFAIDGALKSKVSLRIACDPRLISLDVGEYFEAALMVHGFTFKPLVPNLVDQVWGSDQPGRSTDPAYALEGEYSGEGCDSKLERVRACMHDMGVTHLVCTALDEIGWLFNLRADNDIPFSPFFFAYAIVGKESIVLYADETKVSGVTEHLQHIRSLEVKSYTYFYADLAKLQSTVQNDDLRIVLPNKEACNYALVSLIPDSFAKRQIIYKSVISIMKLVKNDTELFNAEVAQSKDSLAFIVFTAWLEHQLLNKKRDVTEYEAAQKIFNVRSRLPNFKGLSYETISSTGPNAAIIHYAPTEEESAVIDPKAPYLLDSGAHYLEGTTDITRTYKFGSEGLRDAHKKHYTLVLKGHLAVAMARFPAGSKTTGTVLDAYARQPLWNEGLDYNHGTGHGVGAFGNVHEGPLFILTTSGGASTDDYFKEGCILTDEPGFYIEGEYGFRVESELQVVRASGKTRTNGQYLAFKYLTKVPFCTRLIDVQYLSSVEIKWINEYHRDIRRDMGPKLLHMGEKRAYSWLMKETLEI